MLTGNKYTDWFDKKVVLNDNKVRPFFHEREIWFCKLGANVGFEQDGRGAEYLRPSLVLKKFNNEICLIIPLTKTLKSGIHYFAFSYLEGFQSTAILSQIRLIDAKRLEYKSGDMTKDDFKGIKEKIRQLIA